MNGEVRRADGPSRRVAPLNGSIGVAIPNWNGESVLPQCLASLHRAIEVAGLASCADVVIADDRSSDGSLGIIRRCSPGARVVEMKERSGFGATANTAIANCESDHVLLLNNDVNVESDFFLHWQQHFCDADVFAVTAWMLRCDRRTVDSGRRVAVWDRGLIRHWVIQDRGRAAPSLFASGGASIYDRKKFVEIGGFDPLYRPMYTEDFDLSYAAWKRGWKVTYEPRCVAYHRGSFSAQRAFGRRSRYLNQTRNCFLLVWKNVTDGMLLRRHLAWLPLRLATAPFCGRRMLAAAFLLALGRLGEALHRRRDVRWLATVPDRDIFDLFRPTAYDLAHSPYRGTAGTS